MVMSNKKWGCNRQAALYKDWKLYLYLIGNLGTVELLTDCEAIVQMAVKDLLRNATGPPKYFVHFVALKVSREARNIENLKWLSSQRRFLLSDPVFPILPADRILNACIIAPHGCTASE